MRSLDKEDIENLAVGAAILGTGGGGDPYLGKLTAIQALDEGYEINVVDVKEVPDDALVIPSAGMGSPTVIVEKIPKGTEIINAFKTLSEYLGREVYATMPIEAGGLNSTFPLAVGAKMGIPIVDADGMGRAFPELQMTTFHINGVTVTPMALADERDNTVLLKTCDNYWAEWIARDITIRFGGTAWIALYPMTGKELKKAAIPGTMGLAEKLGAAVRETKESKGNPIDAVLDVSNGFELFKGKIVDVVRRTTGGFARGEIKIEGIDEYKGQNLLVHFQNENLVAIKDGEVIASVPDLITLLDLETAMPITTEAVKYGYRCFVIGIPCSEMWRTEKGLEVAGPKYFGYDVEYKPIEEIMGGMQ
ncbi:hypothetical protein Asulf_02050 [Archaeoglobus sulfaticallidus PM70-1]|uniref:DUF917 domain-containing protein n=1 Tax=Archaeoglobus sulfaticallidus PM70-1 TaxID=387631 RepID=N0BGB0_9EURY|nr:DUF917 domain-containing protein [Archaeoglobus sulfaticallidus]AGK62013.1 hypothetical protein Asulf_02050 [Archaeoglobus sulfaticallidus PM70-1]